MQSSRWSPYTDYAISAKKYISYCNIVSEIIYGRLYFLTAITTPHSTPETHFFTIDDELIYERYYDDFGPLHVGHVYRFCCKLNKKFKSASLNKKKIVFYTSAHQPEKRANAAFLIGAYQIIYLKKTPDEAYIPLVENGPLFKPFRDASYGESFYDVTVLDCLRGLEKAIGNGFVDFSKFNLVEYEHHMRIDRGDLTWIVPSKIIAFSCPQEDSKSTINGIRMYSPNDYLPIFKRYNVTDVVRLNKAIYDKRQFTRAGIQHHDLYFPDGTTPSDTILRRFLQICECASGAVAIHCKAGLGRTGSLIGCYLMKHHRFSCPEAIAWLRICRPGSVIGVQQTWLDEKQAWCWMQGDMFRRRRPSTSNSMPRRRSSLAYSPESDGGALNKDKGYSRTPTRTDIHTWNSHGELYAGSNGYVDEDHEITQGDRLNSVKLRRSTEGRIGREIENVAPRRNSRGSHSDVRVRARSSSPATNGTDAPSTNGSLFRSGSASSLRGSNRDLSSMSVSAPRRSSSTYSISGQSRADDTSTQSGSLRRSSNRFVLSSPTRSTTAPTFSSSMVKKPPLPHQSHSSVPRSTNSGTSSRRSSSATNKTRTPFSTYSFGNRMTSGSNQYSNGRESSVYKSPVKSATRQSTDEGYLEDDDRRYKSSTFPRSKSAKVRRSPSRDSLGINGSTVHSRSPSSRAKSATVDGDRASTRSQRSYQFDRRHDSPSAYLSKSYGDLLQAYTYERSSPASYLSNGVKGYGKGYGAVRASYSFY